VPKKTEKKKRKRRDEVAIVAEKIIAMPFSKLSKLPAAIGSLDPDTAKFLFEKLRDEFMEEVLLPPTDHQLRPASGE